MTSHRRLHRLQRIAFISALAWTGTAHADELGSIQLQSGLGQPFRASIPVSSNGINDLGSTCVTAKLELPDGTLIAAPRIGLTHNKQTGVIYFSTKQEINEPTILLHVEIGCGNTTSRNYQLLLDPANVASAPLRSNMYQAAHIASASNQGQAPADIPRKTKIAGKASAISASNQRNQASIKNASSGDYPDSAQLTTLTKELTLSGVATNGNTQSANAAPNKPKWNADDNIRLSLKMSADLADANIAEDAQKNEEVRAEQQRFATFVNGEDASQRDEDKIKAQQEKIILLQAENKRKAEQVLAEKVEQDEKSRAFFSTAWFVGLGALFLTCLAAIVWLALKLLKSKRSQQPHAWKNYNAASDTLIADLSTQTLLDSEFITTIGENYNTAVFSDSQFDHDTITEYDSVEEPLVEDEDPEVSTPPVTGTAFKTKISPATEAKTIEKPAIRQRPTAPISPSPAPANVDTLATPAQHPVDVPPAVSALATAAKPAANTMKQEVAVVVQPSLSQAAPPAAHNSAAPLIPAKPKEVPRTLKVKEIADLMQQAEFWMLLQDPFRAIEILEPYRDVAHPETPVPWIYLLDLYRMVGDKNKYETLIVRIENIFNAKIPKWDGQFGLKPRTLNDFPHIVEKICDLWESDEIEGYLESLLLDNREGARQGFDLPVYRNIVQLITLAREPRESKQQEKMRFEKAQAILFSQQIPQLNEVAPNGKSSVSSAAPAEKTIDANPAQKPAASATTRIPSAPLKPDVAKIADDNRLPDIRDSDQPKGAPNPAATDSHAADSSNGAEPTGHDECNNASSMDTKLELAQAYQEIGEKDGARELLYEVIKDGSPDQSEKAKLILKGVR